MGVKCRYGDATSRAVRIDPGGCPRRAEHLILRIVDTARERSTQESRTDTYAQEGNYLEAVTHVRAHTHMQMYTLSNHVKLSCRHDDTSTYILQLLSPKDVLLHNHSVIIIPNKFNIDTIGSKTQSIFKFPQLPKPAFDQTFWISGPSRITYYI